MSMSYMAPRHERPDFSAQPQIAPGQIRLDISAHYKYKNI